MFYFPDVSDISNALRYSIITQGEAINVFLPHPDSSKIIHTGKYHINQRNHVSNSFKNFLSSRFGKKEIRGNIGVNIIVLVLLILGRLNNFDRGKGPSLKIFDIGIVTKYGL